MNKEGITYYNLNELHPSVTEIFPANEVVYHNGIGSVKVVSIDTETGEYKLQPVDRKGDDIPFFPRLKVNGSDIKVSGYDLVDEL